MKYPIFIFVALVSLICFGPYSHAGPIYVFKQANGAVKFSDRPPRDGIQAKVFTASSPKFSYYSTGASYSIGGRGGKLFPQQYEATIQYAASRYGVDAGLVKAVIHTESAFNPRAVSPKGAIGLMQLMPSTAKDLGVRDPFSPSQNINGGVAYLAALLKKYQGDRRLALAAYNAGEGAVEKYNGIPPYKETQEYVTKVLSLSSRYSRQR